MKLGVLDQAPIRKGGTAAQAVRESVELAIAAEAAGYHRYWLAEHHNSASLACAAPEILIGAVAGATRTMRVGAGGVMLSHYSALKVAESFSMLETLHPGRIDLGIGRAPGSDPRTAAALAHGPGKLGIEHFPAQIGELIAFLGDGFDAAHPFRGIRAVPQPARPPEIWLLGSSLESARYAAYFGCSFSFAHFIAQGVGREALEHYRRDFQPSQLCPEPYASLGVSVVCAESDEEAYALSLSRFLWWIRIMKGRPEPFPSVDEALAYDYDDADRELLERLKRKAIYGTAAAVRDQLLALASEYGAQELVILTICHEFAARRRSYELLAEAFA